MKKDLVVAIDLGASNLRAALISQKGEILKYCQTETPQKGATERVVSKTIIALINTFLKNYQKNRIKGIGVSAASPINAQIGELVNPPNMAFKKITITQPLQKYFSLPVSLANDCTAAVWGEKHFGLGKDYKDLVYITISSGIGGGVIADNRLLIGHHNNAGEIGHFIVDTKYNFPCGCKKGFGHWEGYCSGNNLPRFFNYWLKFHGVKKKYAVKCSKDIFNLVKKADKTVLKFLEEIGQINAKGVSNVIVAYDPEIIILGGAVVLNNKNLIIPQIRKNIDKFFAPPKIVISQLKENICLLGAAALVFFPPRI